MQGIRASHYSSCGTSSTASAGSAAALCTGGLGVMTRFGSLTVKTTFRRTSTPTQPELCTCWRESVGRDMSGGKEGWRGGRGLGMG